MLDGNRYFSEFPDENEPGGGRPLISSELLDTLRAIEKEISQFIRLGTDDVASIAPIATQQQVEGPEVSPPSQAEP